MTAREYTNKNAAVIAAIRDYRDILFIIDNTPDEAKELYDKMIAPHSAMLTGLPSVRNPKAGAEYLSSQIDSMDKMKERYIVAAEFMAWFEPAWSYLTDTEQHFLTEFYAADNKRSGATYRLMAEFGYCESKVERIRAQALKHLRTLLYGELRD